MNQDKKKQPENTERDDLPEEELQGSAAEETPESETETLRREAEDFKRKWYSVTAEYENYRKRTATTRAQAYAEGRADVVKGLFPIADNLELALASCAEEKTKQGIQMISKAFEKLLEEEKIEVICPLGEEFNPEKCEAVFAVDPEAGEASGIVKQVFRKGYEQNGKVLRFAQVSVTK
ncbi:MAG: nucleotide exchange factor GrpE [Clostridia bacterium]|nr:nucleotide exchange factor GrpE [Clostridia bacterium]